MSFVVGVRIPMRVVEVAPTQGECMHDGKRLPIMNHAVDIARVDLPRLE